MQMTTTIFQNFCVPHNSNAGLQCCYTYQSVCTVQAMQIGLHPCMYLTWCNCLDEWTTNASLAITSYSHDAVLVIQLIIVVGGWVHWWTVRSGEKLEPGAKGWYMVGVKWGWGAELTKKKKVLTFRMTSPATLIQMGGQISIICKAGLPSPLRGFQLIAKQRKNCY